MLLNPFKKLFNLPCVSLIDMHRSMVVGSMVLEHSVKFKLFGDTLLCNRHNLKVNLLYDSYVSGSVSFGENASVDGNLSKSQLKRSFSMSNCDICEFSNTMAAYELTVHNDHHMTPIGWRHSGCPVFVFDYQPFEVRFREKLYNLCVNIFADVPTCSNLHKRAKEQNSKGRQGFDELLCCS